MFYYTELRIIGKILEKNLTESTVAQDLIPINRKGKILVHC